MSTQQNKNSVKNWLMSYIWIWLPEPLQGIGHDGKNLEPHTQPRIEQNSHDLRHTDWSRVPRRYSLMFRPCGFINIHCRANVLQRCMLSLQFCNSCRRFLHFLLCNQALTVGLLHNFIRRTWGRWRHKFHSFSFVSRPCRFILFCGCLNASQRSAFLLQSHHILSSNFQPLLGRQVHVSQPL